MIAADPFMRRMILILTLSACSAQGDVLVRQDDWTGARAITVHEREIHRDDAGLLTVRPIVLQTAQGPAFGVMTNVRRRDANGPRIDKMTSGRMTLDYRRLDRLYTHCTDGCQRAEIGVINLSETAFRLAAQTGLPLRVWGQRGRYAGTVPAESFAQVLAQVDSPG